MGRAVMSYIPRMHSPVIRGFLHVIRGIFKPYEKEKFMGMKRSQYGFQFLAEGLAATLDPGQLAYRNGFLIPASQWRTTVFLLDIGVVETLDGKPRFTREQTTVKLADSWLQGRLRELANAMAGWRGRENKFDETRMIHVFVAIQHARQAVKNSQVEMPWVPPHFSDWIDQCEKDVIPEAQHYLAAIDLDVDIRDKDEEPESVKGVRRFRAHDQSGCKCGDDASHIYVEQADGTLLVLANGKENLDRKHDRQGKKTDGAFQSNIVFDPRPYIKPERLSEEDQKALWDKVDEHL